MIIQNLLYIYQLEHYEKKRFLTFTYKNMNWLKVQKRATLDWTHRIGLIFSVCLAVIMLPAMSILLLYGWNSTLLLLLCCLALLPVIIVFSDILIAPLVIAKKKQRLIAGKKSNPRGKTKGINNHRHYRQLLEKPA